jgi:diguanylate cyclase (GGDEF)-like protein/PAS domain S-box-containing protein
MRSALAKVFDTGKPALLQTEGEVEPGRLGWYELHLAPVMDGDTVSKVIMTSTDITTRKLAEAESRKQTELLTLFYHLPFIGMAITSPDTRRWLKANDRLCEILGYPHDELVEKTWAEITHPEDLPLDVFEFNRVMAGQTDRYSMEKRFIRKNGVVIDAEIDVRCVRKSDGTPDIFVATVQDISTRKAHENSIRHLAHYDLLTDLPNRALLSDRLTQAMLRAQRDKSRIAVLFIDLDQFKPVNDQWGHPVGDALLKSVGQRMQECVRASDTVSRMGGDEFVVLISPVEHISDPVSIAEKIRTALNKPFTLSNGQSARISSSTGIAIYPEHGEQEEDLLRHADEAMYAAKGAGRNCVMVFTGP